MNKTLYKLIYSKVRGMLTPVGENARGYNHASTTTPCANTPTYPKKFGIKAVTLSVLAIITPATAFAQSQIQTYHQGNAEYRPTLLRANNGTPIVNIRTINESGVSRNQFGRFDIDEKGVVLNNARFGTDSKLAGRIDGNFWLLNGEASTIVNEVYNPNPTQLNGKDAPYFAQLLSQTANIHGKITGGEQTFVQVVTGQNAIGLSKVVGTTDIKPKFQNDSPSDHQRVSVDIGQLGQVYAGGIHIVSTADGMGVKQAGELKAHHTIHLQADGKIVNSGNIQTTADNGQILLKNIQVGSDITNTGQIHSKKDVLLVSAGDIQNQGAGKILGEKQTTLLAQNDIGFDKIDYQNTDTNLVLQAGRDIQSKERIKIDTAGNISVKAGGNLDLTFAHIQSRNQTSPQSYDTLAGERNIEIVGERLTMTDSNITSKAGEIYVGAKELTVHNNTIHGGVHHDTGQSASVSMIADNLSLQSNDIQSGGHINLASNHDLHAQNNHIQADALLLASTANITSQNNNIKTDKQLSVVSGQNLSVTGNQIQAGSLTARSEQGQLSVADSQIHSDSHLHLQANTQNSSNSELTAKDNISIHSQNENRLTDTQIKAGRHLAISSKTKEVVIDNHPQNGASINAGGLISIQADKAVNLNQSTIQGGAIALHSKNAGVDWQNAKLKTLHSEMLANDDQLKPANGSLTIKSHDDMTIMAGKSIETVGDLELQSDGDLILQAEGGDPKTNKGGRGSEKVVAISSGGAVYLKGKNTDIQGSNITAQGVIEAYATDGDLKLSGVKSDIAPLKDEERIGELTAQINRIDEQINTLNTEYQSIQSQLSNTQERLVRLEQEFKALPSPDQKQQQKFNQDKAVLTDNLSRLGRELIDKQQALEQHKQDKHIAQKSLKIAQTPFNGSENKGAVLNAGGDIRLVAQNGIAIEQAHLKTPNFAIIQALDTGGEREIGKDDETGEVLKMPFAISIEGLMDVYQRGEEKDDGFSLHNNYQPTTIDADKGILIQAIGTGDILPMQSTASVSPYNVLMVGGDYQAKDGAIQIQSLGSTVLQAGQDSIYDRETKTEKRGKIKRKTIITTTTEQIQDADVVDLTAKDIQIQAGDHIYAYGAAFNAKDDSQDKTHVLLQAGDSVRLLGVQEVNQKDVDVQKISRFLGVKYNKSKNHSSHQILSELPTKVVADITQTGSGSHTELQGTQFHTLEKANIVAGVGAKAIVDAKAPSVPPSKRSKPKNLTTSSGNQWQVVAQSMKPERYPHSQG